ncbi:MAG: tyrosine-type recombinase/integrase [Nitrospiraceae bacterium]
MADSGGLTVREYASIWLEEVRARAHPATVETYERVYRLYVAPAIGELELASVHRSDVKALVAAHCRRGKKPAMLLRVLGNLFSSALEDGRIAAQPAQRLWKHFRSASTKTVDVRAFTKDALARFLEGSRAEPLYADLFRTMAFTGARSGEARALRSLDVHELARKLDIVRTFSGNHLSASTKTKAARRIEIPAELAKLLGGRARGRDAEVWLFDRGDGSPLRARAVSEAFRRILERTRLPLHHGTHSLRHTYASNLIQQGVPIVYVQAQLGHRSIQQTVDVYGRWLTLSRASELERFVSDVQSSASRNIFNQCAGGSRVVLFPRTSCSSTPPDEDEDPESA